eukprot:Sspe_Gene.28474::Locus_12954_Transcript_7_10_Confidence_0.196_Length_1400::g.28474::m.28474
MQDFCNMLQATTTLNASHTPTTTKSSTPTTTITTTTTTITITITTLRRITKTTSLRRHPPHPCATLLRLRLATLPVQLEPIHPLIRSSQHLPRDSDEHSRRHGSGQPLLLAPPPAVHTTPLGAKEAPGNPGAATRGPRQGSPPSPWSLLGTQGWGRLV